MVSDVGLCCFCLLITALFSQLLETAAADGAISQISSGLIQKYPEVRAFKLEEKWLRENRCKLTHTYLS